MYYFQEVFITLPVIPGGLSRDDTESHHLSSDHEMKQQLEKEKERDHPSTGAHPQIQEVDKGDNSLEFSLVNEKAKLVAEKLELETQQIALNDKEYWSQSSKEVELKAKLASVQEELTMARASKVAIEKQFIRVQAQYEEQQKRIQQVEKELATAHEEMRFKDRTIGELNGRIKEKNEASNLQLKGDTVSYINSLTNLPFL